MDLNSHIKTKYPNAISSPLNGYRGKVINIKQSTINLLDTCDIFNELNINYRIVFGTLLGIYRDGGLIQHDEDVDIAIKKNESDKLIDSLKLFEDRGFEIIRYSTNTLLSVGRGGDYVDIYLFSGNGPYKCCSYDLETSDFTTENKLEFNGVMLNTIDNPEKFFLKYYGEDWETPIRGLNANKKNGKRKAKNKNG